MTTVEFFQISECFRAKGHLKTLIDIVQNSAENFAFPLKKSIKVIGSEKNFEPQLILLDLVVEKPYLQEYNVFQIRINASSYEVALHEERLVSNNIEHLSETIHTIISNYNLSKFSNNLCKNNL